MINFSLADPVDPGAADCGCKQLGHGFPPGCLCMCGYELENAEK